MTSLFILLGVLLSSLTVYAGGEPQDGFDEKQVEGKWYEIGLASDSDKHLKMYSNVKMYFYVFTFLANGDLTIVDRRLHQSGICLHFNKKLKKGSKAGVYHFAGGDPLTFTKVREDYAFMLIAGVNNSGPKEHRLLARKKEVTDVVKREWTYDVRWQGIDKENIFFPPKIDGCET